MIAQNPDWILIPKEITEAQFWAGAASLKIASLFRRKDGTIIHPPTISGPNRVGFLNVYAGMVAAAPHHPAESSPGTVWVPRKLTDEQWQGGIRGFRLLSIYRRRMLASLRDRKRYEAMYLSMNEAGNQVLLHTKERS